MKSTDTAFHFDYGSADSYRQFLAIRRCPIYRFRGGEATVPNEYLDRLGLGQPSADACEYEPLAAMFDYQKDIARIAIQRRKYAIFADCFAPGTLVRSHSGYVPIESMQEGDVIETLAGPANVERFMSRDYSGEMISVQTASGFFPLKVTPLHKFYVLRRSRCVIPSRDNTLCSTACDRYCPIANDKPHAGYAIELVEARDLTVDDCLLYRQPREEHGQHSPGAAYLRLAGYWLAEGWLSRQTGKLYGIHFGFHVKEESTFVADVLEDLQTLGIRGRIERSKEGQNVIVISASNNELAERLSCDFGEGSAKKRLPPWFGKLSPDDQIILLTALFNGDARINENPPSPEVGGGMLSQSIKFVTISYPLASGVRDTLLGLGIRCSGMTEAAKVDSRGQRHSQAYRILIPRRFMGRFGFPVETIRRDLRQTEHSEFGQTYSLIPIRKLSREQYSGKVYNLTSSGHDSYLTDAGTSKNCGLGKTMMLLEFARHCYRETESRVLIVSPLMVVRQTVDEARHWYGGLLPIGAVKASQLSNWLGGGDGPSIGVTNYEAIKDGLPSGNLGGLILDESSMLKSHYGAWGTRLIEMGRGVPWKLCCTGTPAPNDRIEFANHAVFLDRSKTANEFLASYFINRGQTQNRWELKPHAIKPFYRDLSDWSIFLTNPATYGWKDNVGITPPIHIHIEEIELTDEQRTAAQSLTGQLVTTNVGGIGDRGKLSQIAKGKGGIATNKPEYIRSMVKSWPDESTIIWCHYNNEQESMERLFPEAVSISGSTPLTERERGIERFKSGQAKILISKPKVLGFGLNLQICTRMVFSGLKDSYEEFHQAVKRANRIGSTRPLNVHIPLTELEMPFFDNVMRKARRVESDTQEQEALFKSLLLT